MQIKRLITHSGSFHADELFATVVLRTIFPFATLVRTRDAEILAEAGAESIVYDIGNEYDPERNRFDHHQIEKPLRDEGIAYSSFGLVWKHFGEEYTRRVLSRQRGVDIVEGSETVKLVHRKMDNRLVRDIDAIDNGTLMKDQAGCTHPISLASMLQLFRPEFDNPDPHAMDKGFTEASKTARTFLEHNIRHVAAGLRSEEIVAQAIANRTDPRWIELTMGMPFAGAVHKSGETDILYAIVHSGDEWQLNSINTKPYGYEPRHPLPEIWAGLRGEALALVTGTQDAVFCHTNRHLAIARSRESIMKLLEIALETAPA